MKTKSKILVVDDEQPVREILNDLLKAENYLVVCVSSGEAAIESVKKNKFCAVLLDIKLTGISGIEVLKEIKFLNPQLVVIMITGFGYEEDLINKCKEYGCSGYISKNMPVPQILNNLRLFLKNAEKKK